VNRPAGPAEVEFSDQILLAVLGNSVLPKTFRRHLQDAVLQAGLDDWVPLGAIEGFARELGAASDQEVAPIGVKTVRELAAEGFVVLGEVSDSGFTEWKEPLDASIARIEAAWSKPDRHERGFTCWLANTPRGDERARGARKDSRP
jgi:hypothetical protein